MATSRHLELISGVLTEVVTDLTGGTPSALYKVRTAGTGYSVDHTLMAIALVSQASPFTVSLKWVNLDTGLEVTPVLTHLQLISADVGQKTSANSLSVTLASDQSLPLPTGAATSGLQTTANTSLNNIDSGIGGASAAAAGDTGAATTNGFLRWLRDWFVARTGQKTSANSMSVVVASDQSSVAVKARGQYNATLPTVADAAFNDVQIDNRARVIVSPDAGVATYSASFGGGITALLGTDVFTITGAAGKKITVTKIGFNAIQTTTGTVPISLVKRSTANTGGASTTPAAVPHSSGSPAASAVVRAYTANPVLGTLVGVLRAKRIFVGTGTALFNASFDYNFSENGASGIELLSASEVLAINLNSTNLMGNSAGIFIEWTEE